MKGVFWCYGPGVPTILSMIESPDYKSVGARSSVSVISENNIETVFPDKQWSTSKFNEDLKKNTVLCQWGVECHVGILELWIMPYWGPSDEKELMGRQVVHEGLDDDPLLPSRAAEPGPCEASDAGDAGDAGEGERVAEAAPQLVTWQSRGQELTRVACKAQMKQTTLSFISLYLYSYFYFYIDTDFSWYDTSIVLHIVDTIHKDIVSLRWIYLNLGYPYRYY